EQSKAKMVGRHGVSRANFQFVAEFLGGGIKITLAKVNQAGIIVRFRELWIQLERGLQLPEATRKVTLLPVSLPGEQVGSGVIGVLVEQAPKNPHRRLRLSRSHEGGPPGIEQTGVIRRILEKGTKDVGGLSKIVGHEITEAEKLTNKTIFR